MKKIVFFILFFLFYFVCNAEESKSLIKRTILILPFYNSNHIKKYDYLSGVIKDTLESELVAKDQFNFKNITLDDRKIQGMNLTRETLVTIENSITVAKKYRADVVVIGHYTVEDRNISIRIKAIDVWTENTAAHSALDGKIGISIFDIVDEIAKDMADRMSNKLQKVSKTYFDEMKKRMAEEHRQRMKEAINFTTANKVALGLSIGGGCFILASVPILILDLAYYSPIYVKELENAFMDSEEEDKDTNFNKLSSAYGTDTALLVTGIILLVSGAVMVGVSIPLFFIKKEFKKENVYIPSLNIFVYENSLSFALALKL